jgi:hypothetical protein
MKRYWAATAAMVMAFVLGGCSQTGTTFQNYTGPQLTALSPSNIPAGYSDFTLTVTSTGGFVAKTVIQWNGKALPTTLLNTTAVTAVVPAALVSKAGSVPVNTLNPPRNSQDNGLSQPLIFAISGAPNPVPTITSDISPASAPSCGTSCANSDVAITILGTNFLPDPNNPSEVHWTPKGGPVTVLAVKSITPTQIVAVISGVLLSTPTPVQITVVNPPSFPCSTDCVLFGGGPSNPKPFAVN